MLKVKYNSVSCAYLDSVVQLVLGGQDEHEAAVGVTQYNLPAEQWERVLMSSAATRKMEGVDGGILTADRAVMREHMRAVKKNIGYLTIFVSGGCRILKRGVPACNLSARLGCLLRENFGFLAF